MRWLERLRSLEEKLNILEDGTAKTAKSPFYSFCSASPQEYEVSRGADTDRARPGNITDRTDRGGAATTDPTRCAWCGEGERTGAMIVPFGTETIGHTWLHDTCWSAWYAERRLEG